MKTGTVSVRTTGYREIEDIQESNEEDLAKERMRGKHHTKNCKRNQMRRKEQIKTKGVCTLNVCFCMCVQLCSDGVKGGVSRGGPLWVFVWLRLSSSLGKWKLNTPLQRSGYQVREEERKERQ